MRFFFPLLLFFMLGCDASAVKTQPPPPSDPTPTPIVPAPYMIRRPAPALSRAGETLIIEFEVGGRSGYSPRPEAPDARFSGVTWGIGYDGHANSAAVILLDWTALGAKPAKRLAATHPYYGPSAQAHLKDVADIIIPWMRAYEVFTKVDVAREYALGKHWPGFVDLRSNAQAALMSNGFNRGWSTLGPNRIEMAAMKGMVPSKNYSGMAAQLRKSKRVWKGTSIQRGMERRRDAEAKLMETP